MKKGPNIIAFRITGIAPLIMHSGRLADPLNPASEAVKNVPTGKKATRADMKRKSEMEFYGGLYYDKGKVVIPMDNLQAALIEGARREKLGKAFAAATFVMADAVLEYDGPPLAKLFEDDRFVLRIPVKQMTARIIRTRPIFHEWAAAFDVEFDPDQVDRKAVIAAMTIAGQRIGLGDWRPRRGRFTTQVA